MINFLNKYKIDREHLECCFWSLKMAVTQIPIHFVYSFYFNVNIILYSKGSNKGSIKTEIKNYWIIKMTNTYIFQINQKTKLKLSCHLIEEARTLVLKTWNYTVFLVHEKQLFSLNFMTFSKSRHSLDLYRTAASPLMRMLVHFCEWLSSFIWLDTAGKWHNEKGKWKSFFFSWKANV